MKCIGGELDGQSYAYPSEDMKVGDSVRVPVLTEFKRREFSYEVDDIRNNRPPETITYYLYRICDYHAYDGSGNHIEIKYLVPKDWQEWEAIQHLFRSHRAP